MRILIITQIYPGYKEETPKTSPFAVHYFAKEWVKMGHVVEVVRIWPYRPFPFSLIMNKNSRKYAYKESFELDNVKIHRVPLRKIPGIDFKNSAINKATDDLKTVIQRSDPNLIISHSISPSFYLSQKISEMLKKPMFLTIHNTDIKYLNKNNNLQRFISNKNHNLKDVFYRSPILKRQYKEIITESNYEDVIIQSGIDKKEIFDLDLFLNKATKTSLNIVVASNLIKLKNIDMIIEAINILKEDNSNITLKIIGDGPERANLESLVSEKGLKDNVEFLGYLDRANVLEHMAQSDLFVMVSSPETFGLVYIEAMSKGCIVVGSEGEGIDGVIRHGENGFLCKPRDIKGLVEILNYYINMNESEKVKMLEETYQTVNSLTSEKCAMHYFSEIEKSLKDS